MVDERDLMDLMAKDDKGTYEALTEAEKAAAEAAAQAEKEAADDDGEDYAAGQGSESRRAQGIRQGEAGCPREGHSDKALSEENPEGKVKVEERPGAVSQRGGESCLGT